MKCEEFLDSIDGSENLSPTQKHHMASCPSCKSALVAAAAFTSCRSPLSSEEKMSIASISSVALNASKAIVSGASIAPKSSSLFKVIIATIIVLAGSAVFFISNNNNIKPQEPAKVITPKLEVRDIEEIVVEKKLDHTFTFEDKSPIIKDKDHTIKFTSPCSFVFSSNGLEIKTGRANINKVKSNKTLTILNGDLSFSLENATIEYTVNNGMVFLKVISGSVRLTEKNVVKCISEGETWKTPLVNQHKGVILLPTDVEKLD